jgi:uncharacterized protein YdiU (UPF0061 family)
MTSALSSSATLPAPEAASGRFADEYARLPERFHAIGEPQPVAAPALIRVNRSLASDLGLDADMLASPQGLEILAGNRFPEGSRPVAQAYAGHQFGGFVPQLGDGRALLLGELVDRSGALRDVQLKGSGRTRFSRGGDGRAALGPVLREYILSEAMFALGIPTTRALAAVLTGEPVHRETRLPGAVLTRVAASHLRIGTFQFFAARGDEEGLRILADFAIDRHFPDLRETEDRYAGLLERVIAVQASLVARWMLVGFIHGVMNTDNMTISGETIDYGPCAFMDEYHPGTVFSSIDRNGRYAFANQPHIAVWNLARLGEALLPLLGEKDAAVARANAALKTFQPRFEAIFHAGLRRKLGLMTEEDGDRELAAALLDAMAANQADFTLTFRHLSAELDESAGGAARRRFADPDAFDAWAARWKERLAREPGDDTRRQKAMDGANPLYIPRNHRVEAVIAAATASGDFAPFEELLAVLSRPFEEQPGFAAYAEPPREEERVLETFCGT